MAARRPLVIIEGRVHELPAGDLLPVDATGVTPDTGTPLHLLGYDEAGNLHEVSIGAGLSMITGLLSALGGEAGGSGLDGGSAASTYLPLQAIDGGNAGTVVFHTMYDGGALTASGATLGAIDGGTASMSLLDRQYDGGTAGTATFGALYSGGGAHPPPRDPRDTDGGAADATLLGSSYDGGTSTTTGTVLYGIDGGTATT